MPSDAASSADLSNWRTPPFNIWAFQNIRQVLAVAEIAAPKGPPMPLPSALRTFDDFRLPWGEGQSLTLAAALAATATDGIVVLKDGQVVFEAYFNGLDAHTPHILMSATKAVTGLLAGVLERAGKLDVGAAVCRYVPEVAGTAFDGATVRQLLDMQTGVRLDAEQSARYSAASGWDPSPPGASSADLRSFFSSLNASPRPHGGPFAYISANTDLLGWIMERAGGAPFAELVSEGLWKPLGAEDDAFITTDSSGAARSGGGLNTTVRDFARLGQVMLDGGLREGRQVLPKAWLDDIVEGGDARSWSEGEWGRAFAFISPNMRYRAGWYIVDDQPQTLFAMGIHGQNLFLDPARRVVIAKLSSLGQPIDYSALPMTHRLVEALQSYLA